MQAPIPAPRTSKTKHVNATRTNSESTDTSANEQFNVHEETPSVARGNIGHHNLTNDQSMSQKLENCEKQLTQVQDMLQQMTTTLTPTLQNTGTQRTPRPCSTVACYGCGMPGHKRFQCRNIVPPVVQFPTPFVPSNFHPCVSYTFMPSAPMQQPNFQDQVPWCQ